MLTSVVAILLQLAACGTSDTGLDLANPANRNLWLSHPVIGDVSYDAFVRSPGNPIYTGKPPYEWPVNGFLFRDPADGDWYCYVGLYAKGYLPFGPAGALRSSDQGRSWQDLGIILQGDPNSFDGDGKKGGATPDVSVIADADGYHMVYDWATPDNSDGGLAYAFAKSPAGPWICDPKPIHAESQQAIIPAAGGKASPSMPGYKRVYAGSLVRRKNDWLVLAGMSTPRNAGGMWALVCMTAPNPHGPWSAPVFLRKPQDGQWQPQPVEFFPAYVHDGYVYANLTSVAVNRGYQITYRAPIEDAHRPDKWTVWQAGSQFHAEPIRSESYGIWGQAFHGFIDPAGVFRIMYPAKNPDQIGTINIASRPWDKPFQHGFWLSAPSAPSLGLVQRSYKDVRLHAEFKANGPWRLAWNFHGPLGPDKAHAQSQISPLTWRDCTSLSVTGGRARIEQIDTTGNTKTLLDSAVTVRPDGRFNILLDQRDNNARLSINDVAISPVSIDNPGGAVAIMADQGTCIHASKFEINGTHEPLTTFWLPLEGLLDAGWTQASWTERKAHFRFGTGWVGTFEGARAKWNFEGTRVKLWSPRGPTYGKIEVLLDNHKVPDIDLHANAEQDSAVVWTSPDLSSGRHALMIVRLSGELPVDCVEVRSN